MNPTPSEVEQSFLWENAWPVKPKVNMNAADRKYAAITENTSPCKYCGQNITWVVSSGGKKMPLEQTGQQYEIVLLNGQLEAWKGRKGTYSFHKCESRP